MKDLSIYMVAILPFFVTYLALWVGLKVWKRNSVNKVNNSGSDTNETDPFTQAISFVGRQKNLSNDHMLVAYALYKQVNFGDCNIEKPALYDMVSVAKWDGWNKLKGMPQAQAKQAYLEFAASLGWDPKNNTDTGKTTGGGGGALGPVQSTMEEDCGDPDRRKNFIGGEEIFKAASQGDVTTIRSLLGDPTTGEAHPLINRKDDDNEQTALHWACDRGETDAVKLLLSYPGVDVNVADKMGMTALHYAVTCEFEEVIKLLMSAGANPHQEDEERETPMKLADSEAIRKLLSREY